MSRNSAGTGKSVGETGIVTAAKSSGKAKTVATGKTTITLSSKNYSSWSLRGWLLARFSGLKCEEIMISPDDPEARAEILLLSPSILVPCLTHDGVEIWDTLAIAEYLNEVMPAAGLLPAERAARVREAGCACPQWGSGAHCASPTAGHARESRNDDRKTEMMAIVFGIARCGIGKTRQDCVLFCSTSNARNRGILRRQQAQDRIGRAHHALASALRRMQERCHQDGGRLSRGREA